MRNSLRDLVAPVLVCGFLVAHPPAAQGAEKAPSQILFVCEHGNVKSLMAASYFNQLTQARGLPYRGVSRGVAPDSTTVPPRIAAALGADGFDVSGFRPAAVTAADVSASNRVVTIGASIPEGIAGNARITNWDDVPPASVDYAAARAALVTHIKVMVDKLAADFLPLSIESRISLGKVAGRIDHLAYDPKRNRVYVAELGNNTVGVVDLQQGRLIRTIGGFDEPQGVAYDAGSDTLYVGSGGDGSLRIFGGDDLAPIAKIALGNDADNVRVDSQGKRVYVGYGNGALAVIDVANRKKIANIPLKGHPESFQLEAGADRIFVNVPDAAQIAVVSRSKGQQVASWSTQHLQANYPLAIDLERGRVIPVFRKPARLEIFDATSGQNLGGSDACGDADDVFVDS